MGLQREDVAHMDMFQMLSHPCWIHFDKLTRYGDILTMIFIKKMEYVDVVQDLNIKENLIIINTMMQQLKYLGFINCHSGL